MKDRGKGSEICKDYQGQNVSKNNSTDNEKENVDRGIAFHRRATRLK